MKTSPARRVYQILRKAHDLPVGQPLLTILAWAQVFGVKYPEPPTNPLPSGVEDAVLELLRDLRAEVAEVERSVTGMEAAAAVGPLAQSARQLTMAVLLQTDWSQVKTGHLRADFLAGWHWASFSLPSTEDHITAEALAGLRAELEDLETSVQQDEVPDELRRFVRKQAKAIRDALSRYEVRGVGPLQDAVSQAVGDLIRDQEGLRAAAQKAPHSTSTVVSRMKGVWGTAARLCGDAEKLQKGYLMLSQVVEKALPIAEHVLKSMASDRS